MAFKFSRPAAIVPILRRSDGSHRAFTMSSFRELGFSESTLQDLISGHPQLLGLPQLTAAGTQIVALREVSLPTKTVKEGRVDVLLLTSRGDVVAVEVKLKDNPEVRRHVIAQAFDYFVALRQIARDDRDLVKRLAPAPGSPKRNVRTWDEWVRAAFPTALDPADLGRRLASNLAQGRFPMMIVGDDTSCLQELMDELRPHMNFDLLLADIRPWTSGDGEVLFVGGPDTEFRVVERTTITVEGAAGASVSVVQRYESAPPDDGATGDSDSQASVAANSKTEITLRALAESVGSDPLTLRAELFDCARVSIEPSRAWTWLDDAVRWPRADEPEPGRWLAPNIAKERLTWGRVGVQTNNGWYPGVFWGVLMDPRDHRVRPLSASSPDFAIIISTAKDPNYAGFGWATFGKEEIGKIAEGIRQRAGSWDVYEHLRDADPVGGKLNQWHRLYLRRELADVWRGASTPRERFERWMSAAEEGLRILVAGGEIRSLIDDFHSRWASGSNDEA